VDLRTYVGPLGPDPDDLAATIRSDRCRDAGALLDEEVGDRALLVRVDRIELSKNIRRGFLAFDHLLRVHPEWRGRAVFAAHVYPSREGVPAYRRYREAVDATVAEVNDRWGTGDWTPIRHEASDDYPASMAALGRADAVLVNPVRDGLNLVAQEAMLVSERDAVLALSRGAGSHDSLGRPDAALTIDAYDVVAAGETLHRALSMPADERRARAATLRARVAERTPSRWLADQLAQV